ncbi:MAG TPA: MarR family transcriptional regulator [Acidimicrobiales bacterium]|nr:MarR family transcriptional regulator [Acidimicrobiales bacterium]
METATTNELAARLRRGVTRLNRRLRSSSLGGVTPAQASMLSSVETLKNPTLGELAAREQVQPPSVTRLVRTMEHQGLITCAPDPDDRRSTRVRLTSTGRRELSAIRRRKTEFLEQRLHALSRAELKKVRELIDFLDGLMEDR